MYDLSQSENNPPFIFLAPSEHNRAFQAGFRAAAAQLFPDLKFENPPERVKGLRSEGGEKEAFRRGWNLAVYKVS